MFTEYFLLTFHEKGCLLYFPLISLIIIFFKWKQIKILSNFYIKSEIEFKNQFGRPFCYLQPGCITFKERNSHDIHLIVSRFLFSNWTFWYLTFYNWYFVYTWLICRKHLCQGLPNMVSWEKGISIYRHDKTQNNSIKEHS